MATRLADTFFRFGFFLVLGLGLFCPGKAMAGTDLETPKRVLLINSYHKGFVWTDQITKAVEDVFAGRNIELHVEYMDTKRNLGYLYTDYLYRLLSIKHLKHPYDAVITSDDDAFEFFRAYRGRICPESPHVFCGVNYLDPDRLQGVARITGVNEAADLEANIGLIRRLHPGVQKVVIITDNTTTGRIVQAEVGRIRQQDWEGLEMELVWDVTMAELGRRLAGLGNDTAVLYTFFSRDNTHVFFEYDVSARFVAEQARVPVYCAWSFAWGMGGIGGYMVDGYGQGETAARQVLKILEGTPADQIPVQWTTPIALRFDYRQLAAWNIDPDRLPPEAEIRHRPSSFYHQYRSRIWQGFLVLGILALALAGSLYGYVRAKRSEKRLEKSEFLHRQLFEKSNDAIFILDESSGRCLDANQAAQDITGWGLDELKGMTIKDISPQSKQKWLASGRPGSRAVDLGQVAYVTRGGGQRIARASSVRLDDHIVMGIVRDITHDLEMERQLRQAQKMEAIGTLAGGIAHDFNNILSVIFSYAQLAQINIDKDTQKADAHISQVLKGAKRASELVHQILTFSRQADPQASHVELHAIVEEAVKFLRSSIPASIEIQEDIRSQSFILADPTQVHQVVMNLGTNAYHAMGDEGGTLSVVLEDVDLSEADVASGTPGAFPGPHVRLEVSDTGHGMDTATLAKIFDPYFTTKQQGKGTGMGLSVVDGIIRQHRGMIRVASQVGRGSTFEIFWPKAASETTAGEGAWGQGDIPDGQGHILVVDDEPGILKSMQALLENRGYRVSVTQDPLDALGMFEKAPDEIDLVITDMTMPKMTGTQLSKRILARRPSMPIILCTGFHETLSETDVLALGIKRFFYKPVLPGDLYRVVRELMAS